jgi:hypothetical protein
LTIFLGQNPELRDIGKLLIAWVLLEREARSATIVNYNRCDANSDERYKDNWYRFLVHKLVTGCPDGSSLQKSCVTFITFNYDVSLERRLYSALASITQFASDEGVIPKFFAASRFIHIYGRLREVPESEPPEFIFEVPATQKSEVKYWTAWKQLLDAAFAASQEIRTIAPYEKFEDRNVESARRAIQEAACVHILGYGFDENNSKLLRLDDALYYDRPHGQALPRTILFTNYGDSNQVNKKASRLFFRNRTQFLAGMPAIAAGGSSLYEKSGRDVYGAMALDFDSPEEA